jgi:hypothetical protein
MIDLSPQEEYVVNMMRQARPYEIIEIHKDKSGRPDTYLVKRSQKIMVSEIAIIEVK